MFLPDNGDAEGGGSGDVEERVARLLDIPSDGDVLRNLRFMGLFSDEVLRCEGRTPAAMLIHLLRTRLSIPAGGRDMVILMHELDVRLQDDSSERITSTMVTEGDVRFTAMARTVGLPTAISVRLLLNGELTLTGSLIPTHPAVYGPVLRALEQEGLVFTETREPLVDAPAPAAAPIPDAATGVGR
jgi:saccharopine dehydrogenase-like NADP-dependent oxidoreductase